MNSKNYRSDLNSHIFIFPAIIDYIWAWVQIVCNATAGDVGKISSKNASIGNKVEGGNITE